MESGTIIDKESIYRSNFYIHNYCNQFEFSYYFATKIIFLELSLKLIYTHFGTKD